MNLNQLYYFRTLAKHEHYTNAASELHISQPSLSRAISSLENELGIYLFEKEGRNVRLTKSGKRYLEFVNSALAELDAGKAQIRKEQSMSDGYINIGLISSIENDSFPDWVRSFEASFHKKVFFSCKNGTSLELADGLNRDSFDLIFCTAIPREPLIRFVPVLEQSLVFVCAPDHRLACRESVHISELEQEAMIPYTHTSKMQEIISSIFQNAGVNVRIVSEAEEDRTILGLIQAGLGSSVMAYSSSTHVEGLRVIPLTGTGYHRYVCMGYRKDRPRQPMAELFRRHVLEITGGSLDASINNPD